MKENRIKTSEVQGNGRTRPGFLCGRRWPSGDQVSSMAEDGLEGRGLECTGMEQREGCDLE